ncbi:MAG: homoserine O-acetyltransferase [Fimbriimonadaceae bacterium]
MPDHIDDALFQENERLASAADQRRYCNTGHLDFGAGGCLEESIIAYETWGELNEEKTNAILICHALSGDSHAVGWWDRIVGPGRAIDTTKYFVVGTNVLGGCQGSTGPASLGPNGVEFGSEFPVIEIQDMVVAQHRVMESLGIEKWALVAGGSMGGMQAISWAVQYPSAVQRVWCTASAAAHGAMQIGFNETGRQAIRRDPAFMGGDYYGGEGPVQGLAIARMLGHLSFLSEESFTHKFGRNLQDKTQFSFDGEIEFAVESYLNYQGDKFTKRFDANSFITLTRAIDYFDLKSLEKAQCAFLFTSFDSDWIYPTHQSATLHQMALDAGLKSRHVEISLPWGHDSFLLDGEEQGKLVQELLSD